MDVSKKTALVSIGTLALLLVFFGLLAYENQGRAPDPDPVEKVAAPPAAAPVAPPAAQTAQPKKDTPTAPYWYITDTGTKVLLDDGIDGALFIDGMWYSTSSSKEKQLIAPIAVKIECGKSAATCREIDATIAMGILHPDMAYP